MDSVWEWIEGGISLLLGKFKMMAASIVGKVLGTFGLTMISFDVILPQLKAFVLQYVSGLPGEALNFLGYLGIGQAMSMVFSALTVSWGARMFLVPKSAADALGGGTP